MNIFQGSLSRSGTTSACFEPQASPADGGYIEQSGRTSGMGHVHP